jgi:hypothetical protein
VGVSPGSAVSGASDISFTSNPTVNGIANASTAAAAKDAITAAYLDLSNRVDGVVGLGGGAVNIGGRTFTPGLYKTTGSLVVDQELTLSGEGVYIFQMETTLKVGEL